MTRSRLLKWPKGLPLRATRVLYHRAKQLRLNGDGQVSEALTKLAEALADPAVIPPAAPRARVKVSDEEAFLGVRYGLNGKEVVGLRKEKLAQFVGDAMVGPVLEKLKERGAIIRGHGGKSTQQLPVVLQVGGKTLSKPRFIVVDPKHLRA